MKFLEVTAVEISEFMYCKVHEMQSFSDVTECIFADYFPATNAWFM